MKQFTALQTLALTATYAAVLCQNQVTMRKSTIDGSPEGLAPCGVGKYAAIGDSYSAGLQSWYELPLCNGSNGPNCTMSTCARNMGAYGYQLAASPDVAVSFQFLACTGANTTEISKYQVTQLDPSTNVVTLTAGGDNYNIFEMLVETCIYGLSNKLGYNCDQLFVYANEVVANLESPMVALWNSIRERAPSALIYHLGYVNFYSSTYDYYIPDRCQNTEYLWITTNLQTKFTSLINTFNNNVAMYAAQNGVTFVYVDSYFHTHRFCDLFDTWLNWRLRLNKRYHGGVFHPNQAGQNAYLTALQSAFNCSLPCN